MTDSDLQAYRKLCQRFPECQPDGLSRKHYGTWSLGDGDTGPIGDDEAEYILIGHLEALLGKRAPGWAYSSQRSCNDTHVYDMVDFIPSCHGLTRLSALLAAVEAVMGAKGGKQ